MLTNGFTVFHKDTNLSSKLGRGFVVGDLSKKTSIQYQTTIVKDGTQLNAITTEEQVELFYQVLWENVRTVSPSLHASTDLVWEMLTDDYLAIETESDEDDEDFEEEYEEEDEENGIEASENTNGDFTNSYKGVDLTPPTSTP